MRTFTVQSSRGERTVETALTDQQAIDLLGQARSSFAHDLARQYSDRRSLSPRQWAWVHVLAVEVQDSARHEARNMEAVVNDERQMDALVAMFRGAGRHLQRPEVRVVDEARREYRLKLNDQHGRDPGAISVTTARGGVYLGRITPDGLFMPHPQATGYPHLVDALYRLAQDPAGAAKEYARLTSRCCFCRLGLTDERSIEAGYGPICARHYCLPWGGKGGAVVQADAVAD